MRKLFARLMALLFVSCGFAFGQDLNDGLVAYYPFNGNANDESGNGINGTADGPSLAPDRNGQSNSAYAFDGNSAITANNLELGKYYTVSAWFNSVDQVGVYDTILSISEPNTPKTYVSIFHNARENLRFVNRNEASQSGGANLYSEENLHDGAWHQVVCIKGTNLVELYVDGVKIAETEDDDSRVITKITELNIGYNVDRNPQWDYTGLIDDIRIYNRGLSEVEVTSLYALESVGVGEKVEVESYTYNTRPGSGAFYNDDQNSKLTNGIFGQGANSGEPIDSEAVGWESKRPDISFKLPEQQIIQKIRIYVVDGKGLGGVTHPTSVEVTTVEGYKKIFPMPNPQNGSPFDFSIEYIDIEVDLYTSEVSLDIEIAGQWTMLTEVDFFGPSVPDYQIIEGNFSWQEAKADAEARGGRLAVLNTQAKIDASNAYLQELGEWPHLWIGLTDEVVEGDWRWITGESLTVTSWNGGEPNNTNNEDYALYNANSIYWNDSPIRLRSSYLLELLDQAPAAPFIALDPLYESPSGEALTIDATPTIGFPTEFTYQWCFNGFKIPANLGGTASSINIDNLSANEGTWSVTVTNETGSTESSFEYRLYADSDSDGLSDAYEELISETDINKPDTDNDGLGDAEEFNVYRTNPNSPDTDSDGFTDLYELETAYDPNSAESVPDALVNIMTAIEVKFNAALGATYAIEFSTDSQNWSVIEDDIVGEGGAVERLYSKTDFPTGFFRVERRDQ